MSYPVSVSLAPDRQSFLLSGGNPNGSDAVHQLVTKWPGWHRLRRMGELDGYSCSVFQGPLTAVSAIHLDSQKSLALRWDPSAGGAAQGLLRCLHDARAALQLSANGKTPTPAHPRLAKLPTEREPMEHQWAAIHALRHLGWKALLADDMGLGKTSTSLWALHDSGVQRCLIICPVSVKWNWAREIDATLGCGWWNKVIDGTSRQRATHFAELIEAFRPTEDGQQRNVATIINYDQLPWLTDRQFAILHRISEGGMLICDESHYLKNRNAKRTKLVTELASVSQYRLLLTGTPVCNLVDDLYSQVEIIQPGTWASYWDFAKRHLVIVPITVGPTTIQKITGGKNLQQLNLVMNTIQIQRHKEDVLNLPEKIHTYPELTLDDSNMGLYDAMKEYALLKLDELVDLEKEEEERFAQAKAEGKHLAQPTSIIFKPQAKSAVEAVLRCEQIAQGFVGGVPEPLMAKIGKLITKHAEKIPGRPHEMMFPHSPKIIWLLESIRGLLHPPAKPCVVFSRFNAPMFWLADKLSKDHSVSVLHGDMKSAAKDSTIKSFQSGDLDILFVQVRMAQGFNLTNSQDVLFLGRDWSPSVNRQAEARCHRIGTKGTVNIQIPVVRDTIEILLHRKLMDKESDAQQALKTVTIKELKEAL